MEEWLDKDTSKKRRGETCVKQTAVGKNMYPTYQKLNMVCVKGWSIKRKVQFISVYF